MAEIGPNSSLVTFIRTVLKLSNHAVVGLDAFEDQMHVSPVTRDNLNRFLTGLCMNNSPTKWFTISPFQKVFKHNCVNVLHSLSREGLGRTHVL